ncbi:DUF2000 family protein [Paraburkholderia sp. BCC1876]|uniref:DUF2000 family protein n=1 Tax=Paraburkholderia sp. BCC1876 TaxID=2676303 RepID=UPI0015926D9B|nr:DUF2000 family protein [Paraburkholderia sp. BCC1876]
MTYANNTRKTVLVLNTEFPAPVLMNAIGHTSLGLIGARDHRDWALLDYPSPAFEASSTISEYPVVVLRSKRSGPLEKLVVQLKDAGIAHNVFIDSMLGSTAAEQQEATRGAVPGTQRIVCVALFGEETEIRPLIKSFSVYKTSDAVHPELVA